MFYGEKNGKAVLFPKGEEGTYNDDIYSKFFKFRLLIPIDDF